MSETLGSSGFFNQQDINKLRERMCPQCKGEVWPVFRSKKFFECENCGIFKVTMLTPGHQPGQSEER